MNITLSDVVFIDERKQMHAFDNFMVRARHMKYLHIPKQVNLTGNFFRENFFLCFFLKSAQVDRMQMKESRRNSHEH